MIVHFAMSNVTVCGKSTSNSTFTMDESGNFGHHWNEHATNRHTSDPDFVTCEDCKRSPEYHKARSGE